MKAIRQALEKCGPLFVAALYPCDVIDSGNDDEYTPWFIGHLDPVKLEPLEVEHKIWPEFLNHFKGKVEPVDAMEVFCDFLEKRGYIVLHSAPTAMGRLSV